MTVNSLTIEITIIAMKEKKNVFKGGYIKKQKNFHSYFLILKSKAKFSLKN